MYTVKQKKVCFVYSQKDDYQTMKICVVGELVLSLFSNKDKQLSRMC